MVDALRQWADTHIEEVLVALLRQIMMPSTVRKLRDLSVQKTQIRVLIPGVGFVVVGS